MGGHRDVMTAAVLEELKACRFIDQNSLRFFIQWDISPCTNTMEKQLNIRKTTGSILESSPPRSGSRLSEAQQGRPSAWSAEFLVVTQVAGCSLCFSFKNLTLGLRLDISFFFF